MNKLIYCIASVHCESLPDHQSAAVAILAIYFKVVIQRAQNISIMVLKFEISNGFNPQKLYNCFG